MDDLRDVQGGLRAFGARRLTICRSLSSSVYRCSGPLAWLMVLEFHGIGRTLGSFSKVQGGFLVLVN